MSSDSSSPIEDSSDSWKPGDKEETTSASGRKVINFCWNINNFLFSESSQEQASIMTTTKKGKTFNGTFLSDILYSYLS